jgi:hypothetical protein
MRIALPALGDMGEALLLRALFESFGAEVHLRPVGRPSDFLTAFGGAVDLAVISAHGDAGGLVFAEMALGVDDLVLPDNRFTPGLLAGRLTGLPPVVISTACDSVGFASVFFEGGAKTYLAPRGYPEGAAVPLLIGLAVYRLIKDGASWQSAIAAANSQFPDEDGFVVFERAG